MREELSGLRAEKEELCARRLEMAKWKKTPSWTIKDLDAVLGYLKLNKSRDPLGYANEIFRPDVAGTDLKKGIISLMNRVKKDQIYSEVLEVCDISSIWKLKGSVTILIVIEGYLE